MWLRVSVYSLIRVYKNAYSAVLEVNDGAGGPIVGLYLGISSLSYESELQAIETVFGNKTTSRIPIGTISGDCAIDFQKSGAALTYFQRLDFIACQILIDYLLSPELAANSTFIECKELKRLAASQNISAEVMCFVFYYTHGVSKSLGVRSVSKYIRFWCTLVNLIKQEDIKEKIILSWAFEYAPIVFNEGEKDAYKSMYHVGWWRRVHDTSFEASAFEEKVNDLQVTFPLEWEIRNLSSMITEMKSSFLKEISQLVSDVSKVLNSLI